MTEEVCMYIYVYLYMYIHIHMYMYINVYIHIYISGAEKYGVTEEVCTICAMLSIGNQVPLSLQEGLDRLPPCNKGGESSQYLDRLPQYLDRVASLRNI